MLDEYLKLLEFALRFPPNQAIPQDVKQRLLRFLKNDAECAKHFASVLDALVSVVAEESSEVHRDQVRRMNAWIDDQLRPPE